VRAWTGPELRIHLDWTIYKISLKFCLPEFPESVDKESVGLISEFFGLQLYKNREIIVIGFVALQGEECVQSSSER